MPKISVELEVHQFVVPNHAVIVRPPVTRQEGLSFHNNTIELSALTPEVLSQMCDEFRAAIFKKAGKADPTKTAAKTVGHEIYLENKVGYRG